jgi:hypothetical protein
MGNKEIVAVKGIEVGREEENANRCSVSLDLRIPSGDHSEHFLSSVYHGKNQPFQ